MRGYSGSRNGKNIDSNSIPNVIGFFKHKINLGQLRSVLEPTDKEIMMEQGGANLFGGEKQIGGGRIKVGGDERTGWG